MIVEVKRRDDDNDDDVPSTKGEYYHQMRTLAHRAIKLSGDPKSVVKSECTASSRCPFIWTAILTKSCGCTEWARGDDPISCIQFLVAYLEESDNPDNDDDDDGEKASSAPCCNKHRKNKKR